MSSSPPGWHKKMTAREMWPDWAIFESFWEQSSLQKLPKYLASILGYCEKIGLLCKLMWILFEQLLEKFGLLFTPTSGHTGLTTFSYIFPCNSCSLIWYSNTTHSVLPSSAAVFCLHWNHFYTFLLTLTVLETFTALIMSKRRIYRSQFLGKIFSFSYPN